jgi:hypothetical protein
MVGSIEDRGPAVCRLALRQAMIARKTTDCFLRERSIIEILQGTTVTPYLAR